jgi:two-component system sensor histidine kinase AlgZ
MRDTQILSTLQELPRPSRPTSALVFDACNIGVVLRAVLFVELVVGVVVMFASTSLLDWTIRLSLVTGGALPATLAWLLVLCGCKGFLVRWQPQWQNVFAVLMGSVSGLYGCGVLTLAGLLEMPPWLSSAFSGAILAAVLVAALIMRAKGRTPADTAAQLMELQARIRPHFLFNTLNSAIALVRAEPATAERVLEDLSELFRHALMEAGDSVSLTEEIDLAQRYLAIEQVRFGDRLRVQWSIDPKAHHARLPPLLLQPLVENAVRHGVEPCESGAEVHVSTQLRGSVVVIKVRNTVPAGQGMGGHGLALRNVRDRLLLLHDVQGQFSSKLKNGVYQVRMEVPL